MRRLRENTDAIRPDVEEWRDAFRRGDVGYTVLDVCLLNLEQTLEVGDYHGKLTLCEVIDALLPGIEHIQGGGAPILHHLCDNLVDMNRRWPVDNTRCRPAI